MKQKLINVYSFEELDEKTQKKVLDKFREWQAQYIDFDFLLDMWKERLENIGFEKPDISFSGFYSQGDGASFTCKSIDIDKFVSNLIYCEKGYNKDLVFLYCFSSLIYGSIHSNSRHYSHKFTISGHVSNDLKETKQVLKAIDYLEDAITETARSLSQDIYYELMHEYEYQTSDETIKETIEFNGYEFNEKGEII